jgi:integrative and conjugative element protein (TIGR02256 family)
VLAAMRSEANDWFPRETGGVLIGFWGSTMDGFVVTKAVGPGRRAKHWRTMFIPDSGYHDEEIARHYSNSGRRHTYLGDWHSHPRGATGLSKLDKQTLHSIGRSVGARAPRPVMCILSGSHPWVPAVWVKVERQIVGVELTLENPG